MTEPGRKRGVSSAAGVLLPVASGVAMIAAWYAVDALLTSDQRYLLPTPGAILKAFVAEGPTLWSATVNSGAVAVTGFLAAVVLSSALGLVLSLSPAVRASLYPYLMALQMTPVIVLAPILVLWVGPGFGSVTIITFLICYFPMVVNTTQGLISTDRNLVDFFRMCKASTSQEILLLRVPAALPYFFTGLRIGAVLAPIGAIVGDVYTGNSAGGQGGLGFQAIIYSSTFQMAALFATAGVSCLLGFVFVAGVVGLSWLALRNWHDSFNRADT